MTRALNLILGLLVVCTLPSASAWSSPTSIASLRRGRSFGAECGAATRLNNAASATVTVSGESDESAIKTKDQYWEKAKAEGGLFTFRTKYGALNPYAIYYGLTSIFLGLFWFAAMSGLQLVYFLTGGRFDRRRRLVNFVSQVWGVILMKLVRANPKYEGKEILKEFYKKKEAAMFVANHNSWLDIPFIGDTIGWRNYKLISKKELGKVPILGKAIKLGGHIMVDRTDRRSQLQTLRDGMALLKDGIHLCTYPEGTRSKTGRLLPFKQGAFKMAHKVGAPIIPVSIVGSGKAMPHYWMFARRPAAGICKVIIHEPIASTNKTEEELTEEVRNAIINGLPEDQRPLE